jgi:hypothetical protein
MWRLKAPSGRLVSCYVARLPTADYEIRIVHADQVLSYEVYCDRYHALQRGIAAKERMLEFVRRGRQR